MLLVGALVTIGLTVAARSSYDGNEQRLTTLETRLTASLLQTAQPQLQGTLGRVVGAAAVATKPAVTFRNAMASELAPKGQFAASTLAVVANGQVRILAHVGSPSLQGVSAPATGALFLQAARTSVLITTHVTSATEQRLGYLLSARGTTGVFVVGASQELPASRHAVVSPRSPAANLKFALYFGRRTTSAALIETNVTDLPIGGTVSRASVPFGNNVLTLVAAPREPLAGTLFENLSWALLGTGLVIALASAALTDRLIRRRRTAEALATANQELYQQQRELSVTLQRSLLPRTLPTVPGFEFAARYVPASRGAEVGGDWYSVVSVDDQRFAIVIGDVSGHGVAAAGTMAALRYTIRTLSQLGFAPDEVLRRTGLDLNLERDGHFATALVGLMDIRARQLTLASAGHLPPLLVRDGQAQLVDVSPAVPLGVSGDRPRPTTIDFGPGTTLMLYTDGLVERRGEGLKVGLQRLTTSAARLPTDPEQQLAALLSALVTTDHEDDIAVLTIRFSDPGSGPAPTAVRETTGRPP